ncbi:MAG: NINE protein [Cyanobacteria bacterium J007]|nr:MAG: NINE protein [Cyanobacteria bacterium J007]
MTVCLNPHCPQPNNPDRSQFCQSCGAKLLLGDRYRPVKLIGSGGFGRTFLGVDEYKPSHPRCAIKQFYTPDEGRSSHYQKACELFRQEAIRLEQLGQHPQIPDLLAHFDQEGRQYLVQEFVDGQNLAEELALTGTFDERQIRELLENILPILEFIHEREVIHRDIKPENIIRRDRDGQLFLVDFGAAKAVTAATLGHTGTVIGSAGYCAPEQTIGKATFASDLYSLGVTCVHLLTQIEPFDLFDAREGQWVWRDYLVDRTVSDRLARVLDKLLENPLSRRYHSASEVLQDLQRSPARAIVNPAPSAPSVTPSPPPRGELVPADEDLQKRIGTSYLLWVVGWVGISGLHRLYNGKIFSGALWFCTGGLFGLGQIVDVFLIPGMAEEQQAKIRAKLGISERGIPLRQQAAIAQTLTPNRHDQIAIKLLKAAQARGGQLSVTQAVMDTEIGFSDVEATLTKMVSSGYVSIENDPITGVVLYRFNEF